VRSRTALPVISGATAGRLRLSLLRLRGDARPLCRRRHVSALVALLLALIPCAALIQTVQATAGSDTGHHVGAITTPGLISSSGLLSASPGSPVLGQPLTITYTLSCQTPSPGGTVFLYQGGNLLGINSVTGINTIFFVQPAYTGPLLYTATYTGGATVPPIPPARCLSS
jgi:hypothetical protein